jgi:hypothetical protein
MVIATTIILLAFALWAIVRLHECGGADSLWSQWRKLDFPARAALLLAVGFFTLVGGTKGPAPITQVLRLLFWDHPMTWALSEAAQKTQAAIAANGITEAALAEVEATTNEVWTLSFDWHAPNRLPYHERQNVLAWTVTVAPTNIDGVLYEDHFVSFNSSASTNPAVILIEYAGKDEAGNITRYSASVVTNSFPDTSVVTLQSGSYICYWFRCAVPLPFVNSVRDWNGEALFGSPHGSGKGFDLLGTLVIDDGNDVWVGATTNHVFGSVTNVFKNGINITEVQQ